MKHFRRALWLAALAGSASALVLALLPGVGASQSGRKATILSTASVNGELSPCG